MKRNFASLPALMVVGFVFATLFQASSMAIAQERGTFSSISPQDTIGTAFSYQGKLTDDGSPANGTYDFGFVLQDAPISGNQVASTYVQDVQVTEGLFTVELDFGQVFDGTALWMEILVRPGDSTGGYTALSPSQALTAAPYALALPGLWTQPNTTSPNLLGGHSSNSINAGVVGATISGGGSVNWPNLVTADYATVGGGLGNDATGNYASVGGGQYNNATDVYATVGGGWSNDATSDYTTVSGGLNNAASGDYATVGGGELNNATSLLATVGGGQDNTASGNLATVGGGGPNTASGGAATIGGGRYNEATGYFATVGGGENNVVTADYWATIGGGAENVASGRAATVGGGTNNDASGSWATVGGGSSNEASGHLATVCGGDDNEASGDYSFAAGQRAQATHTGSFVMADSTDADFASVREDTLRVRFNGGATFVVDSSGVPIEWEWVRLWSNAGHLIDTSTGAYLSTDGVWTNAPGRATQENFAPVDGQQVLDQLAAVPIQTWNYQTEDPAVRRMSPTAQDFYAAFGLGSSDTSIGTIDADGVALAAIQALYELSQEQANQIEELETENTALLGRLDDMETRLASLEQAGGVSRSPQGSLSGGWPWIGADGEYVESPGWWPVWGLLVAAVVVRRRFPGGGR